jgi:hypothetical protein
MKSSQEGIEWKPVVEVNESGKSDETQSEEANTKAASEKTSARRKQPTSTTTTPTVLGSRRSQRVIESSSNTSSSEDDKNEANKLIKDESSVLNKTRASAAKNQTATSTISTSKTRSNANNEQASDASELIFAPLIKADKTVDAKGERSNEVELDDEQNEHQTNDEKQSEDAN